MGQQRDEDSKSSGQTEIVDPKKKNVYGENTRGIREKTTEDKDMSTADQMDNTRDQMKQDQPTTGGMGREGTPKDGPSQGEYQGVGEDEAES